jgi:hypothetical protein
MPIPAPPVGTPAYRYARNWNPSYTDKLKQNIEKCFAWLSEVTFGCSHRHTTQPHNGRQSCIDCGATRLNIAASTVGSLPFLGKWKKPLQPNAPRQPEPINAVSLRTCPDCGTPLSDLGICPRARLTIDNISFLSGPVACGKAAGK